MTSEQPRMKSFPTTRWSMVLSAGQAAEPSSEEAIAYLCGLYWPAVYSFARYRGYSTHDAEDLTQGFFAKLLEKGYLGQADPNRGRFRTFLLSSFRNYMANEWDRSQAQKRGGGVHPIPLDFSDAERHIRIEPATETNPETVFTERWARSLLNRVLDRLHDQMTRTGNGERFEHMKGLLTGSEPIRHRELAESLGMSEGAVKVAVHRMRRQFARLLREEVEHTVSDPDAVDDEIRHLIGVLGT